jgi:hypothetical protein
VNPVSELTTSRRGESARQLACVMAGVAFLAFAGEARAADVTFDLDLEFSGGIDPQGGTPWLTAVFDDSFGGSDTVRLTMSGAGLVNTEFVNMWYFNFDPALDPNFLIFNPVGTLPSVPSINTGTNSFMADGDGLFDIEFDFPPPPGDFNSKFTTGESVILDIVYTSAISATSFNFGSAPGGGAGPFPTAAHVQGINGVNDPSGWVAAPIPEPSTGLLLGLGVAGLSYSRRRKITRA